MIFSKKSSQPIYNKISIYIHLHANASLRTYHGSKILQFDTENSFLMKIHMIFYCQYAKFRNPVYEKVHLDLFQSFLKITLKGYSQLSKKFVDKFSVVPLFVLSIT